MHGSGGFAQLAPPLPAPAPSWLPVKTFGGYQPRKLALGASPAYAAMCGCSSGCGVHGHNHAAVARAELPTRTRAASEVRSVVPAGYNFQWSGSDPARQCAFHARQQYRALGNRVALINPRYHSGLETQLWQTESKYPPKQSCDCFQRRRDAASDLTVFKSYSQSRWAETNISLRWRM